MEKRLPFGETQIVNERTGNTFTFISFQILKQIIKEIQIRFNGIEKIWILVCNVVNLQLIQIKI